MKGSNEEVQRKADRHERYAVYCGALVGIGLLAEAGLALLYPEYNLRPIYAAIQARHWLDAQGASIGIERWGVVAATVLVFIGVVGEIWFGLSSNKCANELQHRAEAESRRLRILFGYRFLTEAHCKALEPIRGALRKVAIIPYSDSESRMFASQFAIVIESLGIGAEIHSNYGGSAGNAILVVVPPGACVNPKDYPLTKAMEATGLYVTTEIRKAGTYPTIPTDTPIIQVGEKYIPFDELPYVSQLPGARKWIKP